MNKRSTRQAAALLVGFVLCAGRPVLAANSEDSGNQTVFPQLLGIPCDPGKLPPEEYAKFKAWLDEEGIPEEHADFEDYMDWYSLELRRSMKQITAGTEAGGALVAPTSTGTETSAEPTIVKRDTSATGTALEYYSDGSIKEFDSQRGMLIHTWSNGTKVEKLVLEGTSIVRWPGGKGFVVYSDGTGAEIRGDGEIVPADGKVEILPGGAVRQTLPTGAKIDTRPDGTIFIQFAGGGTVENRADGGKIEITKEGTQIERTPNGYTIETRTDKTRIETSPVGTKIETRPDGTRVRTYPGGQPTVIEPEPNNTVSQVSRRSEPRPGSQILLEAPIIESRSTCNDSLLDALLQIDAGNAGVPKPSADVAQVEQKQRGVFDYLGPAIGAGFEIFGGSRGGGGGGGGGSGPWGPKRFLPE